MKTAVQASGVFRFNGFEADGCSGELRQHGRALNIQEQPFQILLMLLERPGEVISREDLRQRLWPADVFVDFEDGLNTAIKKLRVALGDSAENPTFIATLPRRGYRFIAPVKRMPALVSNGSSPVAVTEPPHASFRIDSPTLNRGWVPLVLMLVLLLVAAALVWKTTSSHRRVGPTSAVQSLAVLPISNLSGDAGQEYFADGMTDALITDLAKLHGLRVISRTSIMRYKKSPKSLPEIARELNVDAIVEGSAVRDGGKVRITAQLVQGNTDQHLWAENYETDLRNIVNLQGDIASRIADQVRIRLSPEQRAQLTAGHPVDPNAYEAYFKGRSFFEHWTAAGTLEARRYYRQAISIDPNYAQAYASLADTYVFGAVPERAEEAYPQARVAALKALQLDSSLAEAHAALAQIKFVSDWDGKGAEEEFQRAIDLNPNWTEARHMYSHYLLAMNRVADSELQSRLMIEIDPLSPTAHEHWGYQLLMSQRYDEAIAALTKAAEMDPNYSDYHGNLALAYLRKGDSPRYFAEAMRSLDGDGLKPAELAGLQRAYAMHGLHGFWRQLIALERAAPHPEPVTLADLYSNLGKRDEAVYWLKKACEQHSYVLIAAREIRDFDSLRADPRVKDLLTQVGFPNH